MLHSDAILVHGLRREFCLCSACMLATRLLWRLWLLRKIFHHVTYRKARYIVTLVFVQREAFGSTASLGLQSKGRGSAKRWQPDKRRLSLGLIARVIWTCKHAHSAVFRNGRRPSRSLRSSRVLRSLGWNHANLASWRNKGSQRWRLGCAMGRELVATHILLRGMLRRKERLVWGRLA